MPFDINKFIARFVEEAREHVGRLNDGLVALEKTPGDLEIINAVFRGAHSIKGSSRMLKLTAIADVAHKLEDALGALRDKKIRPSGELMDLLFRGVDAISGMIEDVALGRETATPGGGLCEALAKASVGGSCAPPPSAGGKTASAVSGGVFAPEGKPAPSAARPGCPDTVRVKSEKLDDLIKLIGEMVSNQNGLKQIADDIRKIGQYAKSDLDFMGELERGGPPSALLERAQALYTQIRQLDARIRDDNNIRKLLMEELQEKALTMRMVPLSGVFESLQRTVRDIARSLGKEADLVIEGGEIELDKKMMEKLGDSLLHMVRNAIDHGIESPEERAAAGKPARGVVRLAACYDAGKVVIGLSDDGGGIPLGKIRGRALKKKMFSEEQLDGLDETALIGLIFQPGFSTSSIITDVSGRGVGMDVVKKNIVEDLKGAITVKTAAGKGTVFSVQLPLTLAIMPVLRVTAQGHNFAITASYVREVIRLPKDEFMSVVDRTAIRLRDEFIPVAGLASVVGMPQEPDGPRSAVEEPLVLIVYAGAERMGLIVDTLIDEEDMVVKSLPAHMGNISLVSGVTISGNNEVINILHVPALLAAARKAHVRAAAAREDGERRGPANILVVDDSINTREIEKSILESYGYRVTLAGDGKEGLQKAKEFTFDAVITDVEMPRLDGFSLTEMLRAEETYRHTPIIIVTSREKEQDKRRGIQAGADAYIVKGSFDQSHLLETVQNLVG